MQAIILAGGYGTRLHPLTLDIPKPMIMVGWKPMIEYLVEKLNKINEISEIFIVSNAKFSHVFKEWLEDNNFPNITIINDGTLTNEDRLGSVGDIQYVIQNYDISEDVMILGWDNFFEDGLQSAVDLFHKKGNTIVLHEEKDLELVKGFNNLEMNEDGKVLNFIEKPENPTSPLHATLIYILQNSSLRHIDAVIASGKADRAWDFIAYLCKKDDIYGTSLDGEWFDIGTLEQLKKAEDWIHLKYDKK